MGRMPVLGLQGKWEGGFDLPSAVLLRAVPQRQKQRNSHYLHSHEAQSELELESTPRGAFSHSSPSGFILDSATCLLSLWQQGEWKLKPALQDSEAGRRMAVASFPLETG